MTTRRSLWPWALVLGGIACTPSEAPRKATIAVESPDPVPEAIPEAEARVARSLEPWVWYHEVPEHLSDGFMRTGFTHTAYERITGAPRRYVAERKGEGLELRREDLGGSDRVERVAWSVPIPGEGSGDVVVSTGLRSSGVLVASRRADGYDLRRFDVDGTLRWVATAEDPGRLHAEATALQLGMSRETLVVYNRRASGPYLDEFDVETGERVARAQVDPAVLSTTFEWPPPEGIDGRPLGHRWAAASGGTYVVRKQGKALVVDHAGPDGEERWITTLDAQGADWWSAAALAEHDDTVIVVPHHRASSGAVAYGMSARDGGLRFEGSPGSIGPIGHSKYSNALSVTVDDAGRLRTYGNESGGRYVGVLDVAEGRLLGYEVWRR